MGQIASFRDVYRERRDTMIRALEDHLPELTWNVPNGGFYVWAGLPPGLDSKAMLPRAVTELVAYTPGTAFFADGTGQSNLRLSFCYPTPENIQLGIRRLATVIHGERDLLDTFAGTGPLQASPSSPNVTAPPPDLN
jgi:DNA-binding transcriptional MocR family regulator